MLKYTQNRNVRVISLQERVFICILNPRKNNAESFGENAEIICKEKLKSLACEINNNFLFNIKKCYRDIRDNHNLSIEDALYCININIRKPNEIQREYKVEVVAKYRKLVIEALLKTKEQIVKNIGKVNMCDIAYNTFYEIQDFSDKNKQLRIKNNLTLATDKFMSVIREEYNKYSMSTEIEKKDSFFCAERMIDIIDAMIYGAENSVRVGYLDCLATKLSDWYFTKPQKDYNYLIFQSEDLDEIKNHLFDILDYMPFGRYLKEVDIFDSENNKIGFNYEVIDELDSCLHAEHLITYKNINDFKSLRSLKKEFDKFLYISESRNKSHSYDVAVYDVSHIKEKKVRKDKYKDIVNKMKDHDLILAERFSSDDINKILMKLRNIIKLELEKSEFCDNEKIA